MSTQPTIFLSHGGGPSYYLSTDKYPIFKGIDKDSRAAEYLGNLQKKAGLMKPSAILVLSAHWEEDVCTVLNKSINSLFYDYGGFPPETYRLTWPVPGSPEIADRIISLLEAKGISTKVDKSRGLDHGVFVPLKLAFPKADVPVLQLSLLRSNKMKDHLAIAEALIPLTKENVLVVGSGFTTHGGMGNAGPTLPWVKEYQRWLHDVLTNPNYQPQQRKDQILNYSNAPHFVKAHRTIEHFLPIMMACAAANYNPGEVIFSEYLWDNMINEHYKFPTS